MLTSEMGGGAIRRQHQEDGAASVYLYIMHSHFTSFQVLKWGVGCMIEPAEAREDEGGGVKEDAKRAAGAWHQE